jgi:hypothetical protein
MRVILIRRADSPDQGVANDLSNIPGVDPLEIVPPSLHTLVLIRAHRPDLIVMETDGCDSDAVSLLDWLRTRNEAPQTILIGSSSFQPHHRGSESVNLYTLKLPRDHERLRVLVAEAQARSVQLA